MAQTRLGFIGLGTMGQDLLREAVKNPRIDITAVCDIDKAVVQKTAEILGKEVTSYFDYTDLLEAGGFDGVIITVPQFAHLEVSVAALEAGYPTFCEKPMALSVRECEQMVHTANRTGTGLMIGQVLRYIVPYRYILELIASGELGKPVAMRTIRTMGPWAEPWIQPWRMNRAQSGGLLLEVNVHEIDLMLCIMGEAASVTALAGPLVDDTVDYEDSVAGIVRFQNGAVGSVMSAGCDFIGKNSGEIYLEKGTIYYESMTGQLHIGRAGQDKEVLAYGDIDTDREGGVYRELREFAEACLGERPITIPGEDGLRAVEVAEAMYASAREQRTIELPLPRG